MIFSALKQLFTPDPSQEAAHLLYVQVVNRARNRALYRDLQVPDTLDGRFDMLALHLFLVITQLEGEGTHTAFIRALTEAFFADMDRSLREMGASDTGVGIRVRKMAQAFYGRLKAYGETITDTAALAEALKRNVWREQPVAAPSAQALAAYIQRNRATLQAQSADAILRGDIRFSD